MTPRAFLDYSTRLVCEATGADPEVVRERLAQSVTVLAIEGLERETLAPPVLPPLHIRDAAPIPGRCCDYGGECSCDEDEPSAADLRWGDMEADQDAIRSACRRGL